MTGLPHDQHGAFPLSALDDEKDARLTRRTVIAGAIATTAAAAAPAIDTPASARSANPDAQEDMVAFLLLSSALTGIIPARLVPEFTPATAPTNILTSSADLDPINIKRDYFNLLYSKDARTFERMLQIASDNRDSAPDIITVVNKDEETMYLGRSLVLLWYLGAWYDPAKLKDAHTKANPKATDQNPEKPEQQFVPFTVASAKAYTQGWIWRIAEAHPMGYSNLQFGYWSRSPNDPNDFATKQATAPRSPIDFIGENFRSL
jgi:hypothetical protein